MIDTSKVTRITVVGPTGVAFERYRMYSTGVRISLQDDGQTLKIFPADPDAELYASLHQDDE